MLHLSSFLSPYIYLCSDVSTLAVATSQSFILMQRVKHFEVVGNVYPLKQCMLPPVPAAVSF